MRSAGVLRNAWGFNTCQVGERLFQFRPLRKGPGLTEATLSDSADAVSVALPLSKPRQSLGEESVGNYSCCHFNSEIFVLLTDWARGGTLASAALVDPGPSPLSASSLVCRPLQILTKISISGNVFLTQCGPSAVFACCSLSTTLYLIEVADMKLSVKQLEAKGLPLQLKSAPVVLPDGRLLAVGGWVADGSVSQDGIPFGVPYDGIAELTISDSVVEISELMCFSAPARQGAAVTLIGNRFLAVFGGWGGEALDDLFLVDLRTRRCSLVQKDGLWHAAEYQGGLFVAKNSLYIVGDSEAGSVHSIPIPGLRSLIQTDELRRVFPKQVTGGPSYPPPPDPAYKRWLDFSAKAFPNAFAFASGLEEFRSFIEELGAANPKPTETATQPAPQPLKGGPVAEKPTKGESKTPKEPPVVAPVPAQSPEWEAERITMQARIKELERDLDTALEEAQAAKDSLVVEQKRAKNANGAQSGEVEKLREKVAKYTSRYHNCLAVKLERTAVRIPVELPDDYPLNIPAFCLEDDGWIGGCWKFDKTQFDCMRKFIHHLCSSGDRKRSSQPPAHSALPHKLQTRLARQATMAVCGAGADALLGLTMHQLAAGFITPSFLAETLFLLVFPPHIPVLKALDGLGPLLADPMRSAGRHQAPDRTARELLRLQDPLDAERRAASETRIRSFWKLDKFALKLRMTVNVLDAVKLLKEVRKRMERGSLIPTKEERAQQKQQALEAKELETPPFARVSVPRPLRLILTPPRPGDAPL